MHLPLKPIQMPHGPTTRGCPEAQLEPNAVRRYATRPAEDPITRALNRVAEVMDHVMGNTCREKHRPINEGDQALVRFLKFLPLQYYGKSIRHRKWKTGLIRYRTSLLY
jgi:hypothetical protein